MLNRMYHIIAKEALLEFRERYGFLSSILYLIAVTFVVFKVFGSLEGPTRVGLFWVIFLFTSINITGNSFSHQSIKRKLSYYQIYDPVEMFLSKLIYNFIKICLAGIILLGLQLLFSGEALKSPWLFAQSMLFAGAGLSVVLCLISALSSYSDNQNALVAILSLPVVIPILLLAMRISLISERFFVDTAVQKYITMMMGIDLLLLSISLIFIPLIWRS